MDPISHGIIGLGISALSGEPVSLTNPIILGSILGAMAPDLDIVAKYKGDYEYLKHHRGYSHSVMGLAAISGIITLGLNLLFGGFSLGSIFLWTFFGALSHTIFDALNSYGVRCLLPFSKKKISANLLMLYDPVITILSFMLAFTQGRTFSKGVYGGLTLITYIGIRAFQRAKVRKALENEFSNNYKIHKIRVMPAMINPVKWDFVIEANKYNVVGQVNSLSNKITVKTRLKKTSNKLTDHFYNTELGRYFSDFTPVTHLSIFEDGENTLLQAIDLRYIFKNNFMHHGTIILNNNEEVIKEIFHPYSKKNNIVVNQKDIA